MALRHLRTIGFTTIACFVAACQGPKSFDSESASARIEQLVVAELNSRALRGVPLASSPVLIEAQRVLSTLPLSPAIVASAAMNSSLQSGVTTTMPAVVPPTGALIAQAPPAAPPEANNSGMSQPPNGVSAVADLLGVSYPPPTPPIFTMPVTYHIVCRGFIFLPNTMFTTDDVEADGYTSPVEISFDYNEMDITSQSTEEERNQAIQELLGRAEYNMALNMPNVRSVSCFLIVPQACATQSALASASDAQSACPNQIGD